MKYDLDRCILEPARERIADMAAHFRREELLPFCRKHELTYVAGNGLTLFSTKDGRSFGRADEAHDLGFDDALALFEVIGQLALGPNECFGDYIEAVTLDDIAPSAKKRRGR